MRIDKFLKISRLEKRREVAKELCEDGDVLLNGRPAKPGSEVTEGDEIVLTRGRRRLTLKISEVKPYANKEDAGKLYEIVKDETLGGQ